MATVDTGQSIVCLLSGTYPCYGQARSDDVTAVAVAVVLGVTSIALALWVVASAIAQWRRRRR